MSKASLVSLTPLEGPGGLFFKNRLGLAPLTRGRADPKTGCVRDLHATYYSQRATGGFVLTEATGISRRGLGWWGAPGIYTKEQIEAWKPVVRAVQAENCRFILQLWHMGRAGHSDVFEAQPVSASAIALEGEVTARNGEKKPYEVPHALTIDEIAGVVQEYATAAKNAIEAGFDGVQIHGANGYLVDQFTQSVSNQRTDAYGGSLENRLRFLREVLAAVTAVVPKERVWIRFSPNGAFQGMGAADNLETFDAAIQLAASFKIGCVEVLDGLSFGYHEKCPPYTLERARQQVKLGNPSGSTLVCGNCGHTKESCEREIGAGNADLISIGRSFMSNPDLPERFRDDVPLADPPQYPDWWVKNDADGYITFPRAIPKA
jgi:N-ethylmaleimide reductase